MAKKAKRIFIEPDKEFMDILKRLEEKIKHATWEGMDRISYKTLTRILARKINVSKII
jgi:hypothetical protein